MPESIVGHRGMTLVETEVTHRPALLVAGGTDVASVPPALTSTIGPGPSGKTLTKTRTRTQAPTKTPTPKPSR